MSSNLERVNEKGDDHCFVTHGLLEEKCLVRAGNQHSSAGLRFRPFGCPEGSWLDLQRVAQLG